MLKSFLNSKSQPKTSTSVFFLEAKIPGKALWRGAFKPRLRSGSLGFDGKDRALLRRCIWQYNYSLYATDFWMHANLHWKCSSNTEHRS